MKRLSFAAALVCAAIILSACAPLVMFHRADELLDKLESVVASVETEITPESAESLPASSDDTPAPDKTDTADKLSRPDTDGELSTPLFWKVSGNGFSGDFYLLGSIHVGLSDLNLYPDEIIDAFNGCDCLAVESDVIALENDMTAQMECLKHFIYSDGSKISSHISDELYQNARGLMRELGIYNVMMDYYAPGMWQQLIDQALTERTQFGISEGVDRYFLTAAKQYGKTVLEVEDASEVYKALAGLSDETQQLILAETVDPEYSATYDDDLSELYQAWKSGDEERVTGLLFAEGDDTDYTEAQLASFEEYNRVLLKNGTSGMT